MTLIALVLKDTPRKVVAMGDSLTIYNSGRYPATLLTLLGSGWTMVNKGVAGNTCTQMISRFTADVINQSPGYVLIWGGINDIYGVGDGNPTIVADVEARLASMYASAAGAGIKVVALTISPSRGVSGGSDLYSATTIAINTWIKTVPVNVNWVVDVYSVLDDPASPTYLLPAYDSGDGIHLTNAGYDAVANAVHSGVSDF